MAHVNQGKRTVRSPREQQVDVARGGCLAASQRAVQLQTDDTLPAQFGFDRAEIGQRPLALSGRNREFT